MPPPRSRRSQTALSCLTALILPFAAPAQQPTPQPDRISPLLDQLDRVRSPETVALSPDGTTVAWTVNGPHGTELHLTPVAAHTTPDRILSPDTITNPTNDHPGLCKAHHPAWSPDGTRLAFLSNCAEATGATTPSTSTAETWQAATQDNLFLWTLNNNSLHQLTQLHGAISNLQWSPDARSIAFLYVANATRRAGALDAMKPWSGVIGEDNLEVQRVYAVDVDSGFSEWISADPKLHAYEFSWSPDSKQITYVAAAAPGENNWWVARLFVQSIGSIGSCMQDSTPDNSPCAGLGKPNGAPQTLVDPAKLTGPLHSMQLALPRFSPDGKQIAFIGGLMSDQGSIGGDIYLIPVTGGKAEPTNLTPNRPASPAWFQWLSNTSLLVSEHFNGSTRITTLDTNTGKDLPNSTLTLDESIIAGIDVMSLSVAGKTTAPTPGTITVATTRQSFNHPPEVWAGPLTSMHQLTHLNDSLKPAWGRAGSISYTNNGLHLQGWLLYPANWTLSDSPTANPSGPNKKYPLIVSVHGGPSSASMPRWPSASYGGVPFSALGYFVFLPNPRGSFGQGEAFTRANIKDFGHGDLSDILAGVDLLEKRFPIDPRREGLTGWSYGGFMTMFAVTQTNRFRAAVAGAGIANWQSYYGQNSIDQWMLPFFGASVYDDPAVYAKSSPIDFIKNVRTPTLLVVGDRDGECPAPQSFEFWHALRDLGVPTQLVVYPDEGHRLVSHEHQRDVLRRALNWFETQMPPQ